MEYRDNEQFRAAMERYFQGDTTLEEESALAEYAQRADLPADLKYAEAIFGRHESFHAERTDITPIRRRFVRPLLYTLSSATAAAAITLALIFGVKSETEDNYCYINGVRITNVSEARTKTSEIMRKLNKNCDMAARQFERVEEAQHSAAEMEKAINKVKIK